MDNNIQCGDLSRSPTSLVELISNLCRPTVDVDELAEILGISPATVFTKLNRQPQELPPRILLPGKTKKVLWLRTVVLDWLAAHCAPAQRPVPDPSDFRLVKSPSYPSLEKRGRGRPRKILPGIGRSAR